MCRNPHIRPVPPLDASDPNAPLPTDARVLYKPIEHVQGGGCYLDVYMPKGADGPVPLVLFIHSGVFTMGASRTIPFRSVRWLLAHGVAVASIEYRLLPHVTMSDIRSDLLDAYRFVQTGLNASLPANVQIDTQRVAASGASAGGTLLLYLAADIATNNNDASDNAPAPLPPLRAAVPFYPLADFDTVSAHNKAELDKLCEQDADLRHALDALRSADCSTGAELPDHFCLEPDVSLANRLLFLEATIRNSLLPALLLGDPPFPAAASPLGLLSASFPPVYVISAGGDTIVSPAQSEAVTSRLAELGVEAHLAVAEGMQHGQAECFPIAPTWPEGVTWWEDVIEPAWVWAVDKLRA